MPERQLGDWLDGYMQYTENTEPPERFRLWMGISTIASALRRKVFLQWDKPTFANLYVILVAPSGRVRKGTAMAPAYDFLTTLGIRMAAESVTREALIKELAEAVETTPTNDNTKTPMFHSSLTIFSEELTVFLGYGSKELLAAMCNWYDCRPRFKYKTKTQGTDEILNVWVNLIGATTPELLQKSLPDDAIGGGFTSRTIFVYEDRLGKIVELPILRPEEITLQGQLMHDLEIISMLAGQYQVSPEWLKLWVPWYRDHQERPTFTQTNLAGYNSRRQTHLLKLCMICNASRADGNMQITEVDFKRALWILEFTEQTMARTFAGIGQNRDVSVMNRIMQTIVAGKTTDIKTLQRLYHQDADNETLLRILQTLEAMGFCKLVTDGVIATVIFNENYGGI